MGRKLFRFMTSELRTYQNKPRALYKWSSYGLHWRLTHESICQLHFFLNKIQKQQLKFVGFWSSPGRRELKSLSFRLSKNPRLGSTKTIKFTGHQRSTGLMDSYITCLTIKSPVVMSSRLVSWVLIIFLNVRPISFLLTLLTAQISKNCQQVWLMHFSFPGTHSMGLHKTTSVVCRKSWGRQTTFFWKKIPKQFSVCIFNYCSKADIWHAKKITFWDQSCLQPAQIALRKMAKNKVPPKKFFYLSFISYMSF